MALFAEVKFWEAIAALAWPVAALVIALMFRNSLGTLLKREQLKIKVGGMEITVAEAAKQTGEGLAQLQARLAQIEASLGGARTLSPSAELDAGMADPFGSPPPVSAKRPVPPGAGQGASILWVDDSPANNAFLIDQIEKWDVQVRTELSTEAAMAALAEGSFTMVISDLGRKEGGRGNAFAGRDLIQRIRKKGLAVPILIFASSRALEARASLIAAGAEVVTSSAVDVLEFVRRHSGADRAVV